MNDLTTTLPSPASRLPFDLLARIFAYNIGTLMSQRGYFFSSPGWLADLRTSTRNASQVCRNWRNTAIAYPFLWNSMIDFTKFHPDWIHVLLDRCRDVPIVAKISGAEYRDEDDQTPLDIPAGWDVLFENLDRIRKLDVSFFDWTATEPGRVFIYDKLRQPAVVLEKLFLGALCLEEDDDNGVALSFPPSLFAGIAPRFRRLELKNIALGPNLPYNIFCNLVSLSLTFETHIDATPTSQWLQLLSVTPLLEKLKIEETQRAPMRLDPSSVQSVQLGRLVRFSVSKDLGDCVDLLKSLVIPPACSFTIECGGISPGSDYSIMHSILLHRLSSIPRETPTNTIEIHSHPRRLSFGSRPDSAFKFWVCFDTSGDEELNLTLTDNGFDPPLISLLALFSQASTLHLESHGGQLLTTALHLFEGVTILYTDVTTDALLSVLSDYVPEAPNHNVLLPALVRINSGTDLQNESTCALIYEFLMDRRDCGYPLENFMFFPSHYRAENMVRNLRGLWSNLGALRGQVVPSQRKKAGTRFCDACRSLR